MTEKFSSFTVSKRHRFKIGRNKQRYVRQQPRERLVYQVSGGILHSFGWGVSFRKNNKLKSPNPWAKHTYVANRREIVRDCDKENNKVVVVLPAFNGF